ncbi:MAG: Ig-like domain-containing protein [Patescibacteria group bacterium]
MPLSQNPYSSPISNKPQMVSSRLTRKQQKDMTKQTLILSGLAIVILLLFIFVILPGAINLFFKMIDSNSGTVGNKDDVPPQTPVLFAPPTATNSASLNLTGYGEPDSKVVFVLDSQEVAQVDVDAAGNFQHLLDFSQGDHNLTVYGVDEAGNESIQTKNYSIFIDTEKPSLELESPQPDSSIELKKNQLTVVKGKTEPGSKVYVNGRLTIANSEGVFSTTHLLNEGENKLEIKIVDKAGNENMQEIKVNFRY